MDVNADAGDRKSTGNVCRPQRRYAGWDGDEDPWVAFQDPAPPPVPISVMEISLRLIPPPLQHQHQSQHLRGPLSQVQREPRMLAPSHFLQVHL